MAQRPGGLAQRTPAPAMSAPCMPQTVPPLHQLPPGRPSVPYQQAVQPPKKPTGRGVTADSPTDKTAPMGGTCAQDCGRSSTRGRGGSSRSTSCPEVCRRRRVRSHHVRRAICLPGQCPVSHHYQHLKEPSLSGEVGQGLPSAIPCGWRQTFIAVVGGRTWSISSGSTTNSALPPLGRQNGLGSRSGSSTTSSSIRRKPWPSKKPILWTSWPTSKAIFIRPPASTWMASGVSQVGSSEGAIIMGK